MVPASFLRTPSIEHRWILGLAVLGVATGCGLREIDPPSAPQQVLPHVEEPARPPTPHHGRLILDTVGEPAQVDEVTSLQAGFEDNDTTHGTHAEIATKPLCAKTPCVIDLGIGTHILRYARTGDDQRTSITSVEVGDNRTVLRHDMGYYRTHKTRQAVGGGLQTIGIIAATLGVPFLIAGAIPLGDTLESQKSVKDVQDTLQTTGLVMMVSGAGLLVVGELIKVLSRNEYQKGSTTQWVVPPEHHVGFIPPAPPPPPPAVITTTPQDAGAPLAPPIPNADAADAGAASPAGSADAGAPMMPSAPMMPTTPMMDAGAAPIHP